LLTATRSDPRESATETKPPHITGIIVLRLVVWGKGEKSGVRAHSSDR